VPLAALQQPERLRAALLLADLLVERLLVGLPPQAGLLLVGQLLVALRPAEQLALPPERPQVVLALQAPLAALAQTPDSKPQAALTIGTAEETKLPISAASDNPGILNLDAFKRHFERFAIRRHFHRHFAIDQLIVN
jgi:hypothetical protein